MELIVALDGPQPYELLEPLADCGVLWFKIGPQTIANGGVDFSYSRRFKLFFDLKLADTQNTCRETVKQLADKGVAAISTFTDSATDATLSADTNLLVWRVVWLSDESKSQKSASIGNGVICPIPVAPLYPNKTVICPGIRLPSDAQHGHVVTGTPQEAAYANASFIVVGRPIWAAPDPIFAAKAYLAALPASPGTREEG